MQITDGAKEVFQKVLEEKKCDALKIALSDHDGGKALNMECVTLSKDDHAININGLKIIMDEDTEEMLEHYVFDKDETGGLKLVYKGPHSCHCNCGCDGCDDDCDCCH